MIDMQVHRGPPARYSTPGQMIVDMAVECFTLEDPTRKRKIPGDTCIPPGKYKAQLHPRSRLQSSYRRMFGAKHAGMILLRDVPQFSGILIHIGNRTVDTRGCILVGEEQDVAHDEIRRSKDAYHRVILPVIVRMAHGEPCWVWVR